MRSTEKNKGLITALIALAVSLLAVLMLCACDGVQPEPQPQPKPQPSIFTLTYIAGENGRIVGNAEQTVIGGESGTEVTAIANYGYAFVKWSDGVTTASRTDKNVSDDIEATAEFKAKEILPEPDKTPMFMLTYLKNIDEAGIIVGFTPQTVKKGESGYKVTAVAYTGYVFVKWSDGVTTAERTETNVTRDIAVTAEFKKAETPPPVVYYNVSFGAGAGGSIIGETPQRVESGKSARTVIAVPDDGYRFVKWSDGVTTAERTETNVTQDIAVTAEFEKVYKITYTVDGHGYINGKTEQLLSANELGEAVTAMPEEGYVFAGWSDVNTDGTRRDVMDENKIRYNATEIRAYFEPIKKTFKYNYGINIAVNYPAEITVDRNRIKDAEFFVPELSGYEFAGWYADREYYYKVANEKGLYMLGYSGLNLDTDTLYARWKKVGESEVITEKILLVFVDEIQAELESNLLLNYKMTAIERKICDTIPKCMYAYLNEWFAGRVRFELDMYYTNEPVGSECFTKHTDFGIIEYAIETEKISELNILFSSYHSVLTGFSMNDFEHKLHFPGGGAYQKYAYIHLDEDMRYGIGISYLKDVVESGYRLTRYGYTNAYLHEYTHTVETLFNSDNIFNFHDALKIENVGDPVGKGVVRDYLLCQFEANGEKVGIPAKYWERKHRISVNYVPVANKFNGGVVKLIAGDGLKEEHTYVSGHVDYGESASVEAVPYQGYAFSKWTDGVTTARRTDVNIISRLRVEAIFIKLD